MMGEPSQIEQQGGGGPGMPAPLDSRGIPLLHSTPSTDLPLLDTMKSCTICGSLRNTLTWDLTGGMKDRLCIHCGLWVVQFCSDMVKITTERRDV
jgi:hypothetical protein